METHRWILTTFVFTMIVAMLFYGDPSITGFVPSETQSQGLDIDVTESQRFKLSSNGEILKLTSLLLSGNVEGDGLVTVYLSDGEAQWLVYSNKKKLVSSSMAKITGMAVSELNIQPGKKLDYIVSLPQGYATESGIFDNVCIETCMLAEGLFDQSHLYMDVVIEPGASLHISGISFSVMS